MLGDNNRKIGVGLTFFGVIFLILGCLFFFDKAFLALGNVLFLTGIVLLIGPSRTVQFFRRKGKMRGTVCFFCGIILVLWKWPMIGMMVELFGIINLFGNFFPIVISFLRQIPIFGKILSLPGIRWVVDRFTGTLLPFHHSKQ